MARRSSYRLGRRLKSSAKARLDYITYLQSGGDPRAGKLTPEERGRLGARFSGGGALRLIGWQGFDRQELSAVFEGGGSLSGRLTIPVTLGAVFDGGGNFRMNIFPPITFAATFNGGGELIANAVQSIGLQATFGGGGELSAKVPRVRHLRATMQGGGELTGDIRVGTLRELSALMQGGGAMSGNIREIAPELAGVTSAHGPGALSFNAPATIEGGYTDILFVYATYNTGIAVPAGFTNITGGITRGTGGADPNGNYILAFMRNRATAGEPGITITDAGSYQAAVCVTLKGVSSIDADTTMINYATAPRTTISPLGQPAKTVDATDRYMIATLGTAAGVTSVGMTESPEYWDENRLHNLKVFSDRLWSLFLLTPLAGGDWPGPTAVFDAAAGNLVYYPIRVIRT